MAVHFPVLLGNSTAEVTEIRRGLGKAPRTNLQVPMKLEYSNTKWDWPGVDNHHRPNHYRKILEEIRINCEEIANQVILKVMDKLNLKLLTVEDTVLIEGRGILVLPMITDYSGPMSFSAVLRKPNGDESSVQAHLAAC